MADLTAKTRISEPPAPREAHHADTVPSNLAAEPLAVATGSIPAETASGRIIVAKSYDDTLDIGSALAGSGRRGAASLPRLRQALDTIYRVSNMVLAEDNLAALSESVMDAVLDTLKPDRTFLVLRDETTGELTVATTRIAAAKSAAKPGTRTSSRRSRAGITAGPDLPSLTLIRSCIDNSMAVITEDARIDPRFKGRSSVHVLGIHSAICVPVRSPTRKLGAIYADRLSPGAPFAAHDLDLLAAIGRQAGFAFERARVYEDMETLFYSCVRALVGAIEAKDVYTSGHSERVASFAMSIADVMGVDAQTANAVRLGALLHDIGKIGVPEAILCKPGRLTDEEFDAIKTHPARGAEILGHIGGIPDVVAAVRWHHEMWTGGGYPDGLSGLKIPLTARIVAVADAFDAMTSNRAYRRNLSVEEAIREFRRCAGTQFDADVCSAMVGLLESGKIIPCNDLFARGIDVRTRVYLRPAG